LQKIGIKKGVTLAQISCADCDVDNDFLAETLQPNINGLFVPEFAYKADCEGCGRRIEFSVIEI